MNTDWSNPVPNNVLARGEREPAPRTIRFPKELAAAIATLAEERGQDFTTVTLYLLMGALAEVNARRRPGGKKRPAPHKRVA